MGTNGVGLILGRALRDLEALLPKLSELEGPLQRLGDALIASWSGRGKVLLAGNGGSAADAMHFAEEMVVRYHKDRRAAAAVALCDPTVLTCAGNDLGYERVFERQVEALGNPGDVFVAMTTSGNSANLLRAIDAARAQGMVTVAFLGKDGGAARGRCEIEILVPSSSTARVQEAHKVLFHALCEWIDQQLGAAGGP
jgi:D-sedoheptulose 7-phosphate isomerase